VGKYNTSRTLRELLLSQYTRVTDRRQTGRQQIITMAELFKAIVMFG